MTSYSKHVIVKVMKNTTVQKTLNNLIFGLILGVAFLLPVFFLTVTNEYFEFNKLYFFALITAVLALTWCAKMLVEKKVYFAKSPIDFPLLLLLVGFILSTLTSLDKTASLFGSYGRWFPSLFGFVTLYFFYYAVSTNVDSTKKIRTILYGLAGATAIPSFLGLINYAGLTIPFMNLFNQKGFLLTGTSSTLAVTALIGSVLCALLAVNIRTTIKKLAFVVAFLVDFMAVAVFGGAIFALVALAVVALGLAMSSAETLAKNKIYILPTLGAVIAFVALYFVVPQTSSLLKRDYPREVLPSIKESWIVSSTTIRDFPIFGSGVSTFYLNYPRYKTLSQNATPTWNVNFDKPANEAFNILSTMGIFGLAVYAMFVAVVIKLVIRTTKVKDAYKGLSVVLAGGLIVSLSAMLLTYTSFLAVAITFILLALLTAEATLNTNKAWAKLTTISLGSEVQSQEQSILVESRILYKKEVLQYIIALPIVALTVFGVYQGYLQYAPEVYIRKAVVAANNQNVSSAYDYQVKAIAVNPNRSQYHRLYTNTNLVLAQSLSTKENLTDQEKTTAQNLLAQALRNIRFATENLNPLDSANWTARAQIYKFLIPIAKDADQFAVQAYNTAIQLDPTNPVLRVELGGIYYAKEDYLSAGNLFKQAVNLKGDYANARYNLANALYKLKAYSDAKAELEIVQTLVEKDGADYKLVLSDIETVDKELAQVAGAQTATKPSVESIEGAGKPTEVAPLPQEPLTKPGEAEPIAPVEPVKP